MKAIVVSLIVLPGSAFAFADEAASVSLATTDVDGFLVHEAESPFQAGMTQIRVLLPSELARQRRYPAIYVLPVEAPPENRYGDGLLEVKKHDLHNKHQAIFVAPTFSQVPWYADHPTDPAVRQESYFLKVVVPYMEKAYPVLAEPKERLLLGFSKSGWGAWSFLLRHPEIFGRAVAWDAPLMMDRPGEFRSAEIFGTRENFDKYAISGLLQKEARSLSGRERLILMGFSGFHQDHLQMHALLDRLKIPHEYRDGPLRKHDWHSGWVAEAVELLLPTAGADEGPR
jgi:S-formylglutathione hydrolase FrmB